jgi:hypothetical protein
MGAYPDVDIDNIWSAAVATTSPAVCEEALLEFIKRLWRTDAALTGVGLLMLGALAASLVGLWLDPRVITGAPAWLKPAKFAVSIAIYTLTLAWVFTYLPEWTRTRRIVGRASAAIFVLELAIIDLQAWRGVTSHFNVATPLDTAMFSAMGAAIALQTLTSVAVAVALWRQAFANHALGWALRLGMSLTIVGAFSGGLMTRPTAEQLEQARTTQQMPVAGAHTVGAPDGGPGVTGTGWSVEHGDLRVPHFLGLHALQALALVALLVPVRWGESRRVRITVTGAASYAALFGILVWQAFRGQSIVMPDAATLTVLTTWAAASAIALLFAARPEPLGSAVAV